MTAESFQQELGLLKLADATAKALVKNRQAMEEGSRHQIENHVINWFLPPVTHALKGGVRTVFMFAQNFTEHWGTLNQFVIYSYSGGDIDTTELCRSLREFFPNLRFAVTVFRKGVDDIDAIPASNASFCTLWTTAYLQLKYNKTFRKYYLMQDFEPSFYQAGNIYGVIEQTYRFGFSCIANTKGVGDKYLQYSNDVTVFTPGVDKSVFHPESSRFEPNSPARVVFYGRPSNPRNCFLLGLETLKILKKSMGGDVEILSVGERWREKDFGVEKVIKNLGLLGSLEEVASIYRTSDVGLVFMMTPHPSYQPLEYMASGCVAATNRNESNSWLLNDRNSLLLEPIPAIAAERICNVLRSDRSWRAMRDGGLKAISALSWESAFECVRARICGDQVLPR